MSENKLQQLTAMKKGSLVEFTAGASRLVLCPDMGGRVFAGVCGISVHRIDLDCVARPDRPFNNYGGGNFWPAPEGGKFAFNYRGGEWYVQPCINTQPFEVLSRDAESAVIWKRTTLVNRTGTVVETLMKRELKVLRSLPSILAGSRIQGSLAYQTVDSFEVLDPVTPEQALIGAWTLEQFEARESTVSFCRVENPAQAINFDFYDRPGDRIACFEHGFTYKTDGHGKGQIGIKRDAAAAFIGFYDLSRRLLCIRENRRSDDLYFNIADNDQPDGPYSAADNYSIFNSDSDMQAFELETVGGARVRDGLLEGSRLTSVTTFAVFDSSEDLRDLVYRHIGG